MHLEQRSTCTYASLCRVLHTFSKVSLYTILYAAGYNPILPIVFVTPAEYGGGRMGDGSYHNH